MREDIGAAGQSRIRTPDQRVRVFISSTLGELAAERQAARTSVEQLRLTPIMFELGARPHPPRALYRSYLAQSDIFVGIYWQRYGWVAPDMDISGLEDELLLSTDVPRLIYVKRPAPEMEPRLAEMLRRLEGDEGPSYKPFGDADELAELLLDDLALLLAERFQPIDVLAVTERRRSNLPASTSTFVGRRAELTDLRSLLDDEGVRLITLAGPGGTGKTRLAIEVAWTEVGRFEDAVLAPSIDNPESRTSGQLNRDRPYFSDDVDGADSLVRRAGSVDHQALDAVRGSGRFDGICNGNVQASAAAAHAEKGRNVEILGVIVAGIIIGLLGKLIAPGDRDNIPLWLTVLCGVVGVVAGYYIAAALGVDETDGIDWIRWIISIAVAVVAVMVAATVTGRRRGRPLTTRG